MKLDAKLQKKVKTRCYTNENPLVNFQILGALCMMCAAPAFHSTQHWFLLVVVLGFIGTLYFTLHNLSLDAYVKNLAVNFTQVVCKSNCVRSDQNNNRLICLLENVIINICYFINRSFGLRQLLPFFILLPSPRCWQTLPSQPKIQTSSIGMMLK